MKILEIFCVFVSVEDLKILKKILFAHKVPELNQKCSVKKTDIYETQNVDMNFLETNC